MAESDSSPTAGNSENGSPIGGYEDWPASVRSAMPPQPTAPPAAVAAVLGVRRLAVPIVVEEDHRQADGVSIRRLRWSVGYGPDTTAWLLRPSNTTGPLPGILGMHCHGGVRSVGAEQLVDLGPDATARATWLRDSYYGGRAVANDLARQGHAVLVHDTFSWGSRRFDLSQLSPRLTRMLEAQEALWREQQVSPTAEERFDLVSSWHEDTVAKAAGALGLTLAGAVLTDDLVALEVLARDPGTDPARLGTFGFSGGGGRSLLLAALDERIAACVVACMMATFTSLVPAALDTHSWLLHSPGLWSLIDWPDLTVLGSARFLVQYRTEDHLFPLAGMRAAHDHLESRHRGTDRYRGTFRPGDHRFDPVMQEEAAAFLADALQPPS